MRKTLHPDYQNLHKFGFKLSQVRANFQAAPLIILQIRDSLKLAVYDSMYIALAEKLGYPLITDDKKQAKAAAAEGITLKPITDFKPEDS